MTLLKKKSLKKNCKKEEKKNGGTRTVTPILHGQGSGSPLFFFLFF
jgi:hypothetical protein